MIPLLAVLGACGNQNNTQALKTKIKSLEEQQTGTPELAKLYQRFYKDHPEDSINGLYLLKTTRYYQQKRNIDSARFFAETVVTQYPTSPHAAEAMFMFASFQKDLSERIHWCTETNQRYPQSEFGQDALIAMAVD